MRTGRPVQLFVALALAFAASACRSGQNPTITSSSPTPTPTPSAAETASPQPCQTLSGGTQTHAYLTDVRLGSHEGFDRITFQFEPAQGAPKGIPTYNIKSVYPPFTRDPSDKRFEVMGPYYSVVVFHGGTGVEISGETPIEHYKGPKEFKTSMEVLVEAEESGDFEATLEWVMGTSRPSCPKATTLEDPDRLTIDFPH